MTTMPYFIRISDSPDLERQMIKDTMSLSLISNTNYFISLQNRTNFLNSAS